MERQITLAEINDELSAARTNKKEFPDKLENIIPWENFIEIIQPSYYRGELGNKPYPLELMLRRLQEKIFAEVVKILVSKEQRKEHQKSSVRCKVKHVFAAVKNIFRYRKTQYRGLRN
jgi:hypothetical protein